MKKQKLLEINLSTDDDYYSQRNNRYNPLSACLVTSFVMALAVEGVPLVEAGAPLTHDWPIFVYPSGLQPEDALLTLLRSPWGYEMRDQYSWAKREDVAPNEVHMVVSEAVNRLVGKKVTVFETNKTIHHIFRQLEVGHPLVITGSFTDFGHAVTVVGATYTPGGEIKEIIVDDPYGNYKTNYRSRKGNNIHIPVMEFIQIWSGWYHRFDKNGV